MMLALTYLSSMLLSPLWIVLNAASSVAAVLKFIPFIFTEFTSLVTPSVVFTTSSISSITSIISACGGLFNTIFFKTVVGFSNVLGVVILGLTSSSTIILSTVWTIFSYVTTTVWNVTEYLIFNITDLIALVKPSGEYTISFIISATPNLVSNSFDTLTAVFRTCVVVIRTLFFKSVNGFSYALEVVILGLTSLSTITWSSIWIIISYTNSSVIAVIECIVFVVTKFISLVNPSVEFVFTLVLSAISNLISSVWNFTAFIIFNLTEFLSFVTASVEFVPSFIISATSNLISNSLVIFITLLFKIFYGVSYVFEIVILGLTSLLTIALNTVWTAISYTTSSLWTLLEFIAFIVTEFATSSTMSAILNFISHSWDIVAVVFSTCATTGSTIFHSIVYVVSSVLKVVVEILSALSSATLSTVWTVITFTTSSIWTVTDFTVSVFGEVFYFIKISAEFTTSSPFFSIVFVIKTVFGLVVFAILGIVLLILIGYYDHRHSKRNPIKVIVPCGQGVTSNDPAKRCECNKKSRHSLTSASPEVHEEVTRAMLGTIKSHVKSNFTTYHIVGVQKISNCCLWTRYEQRRRDIQRETGADNLNERFLFYGSTAVNNIMDTGFDERYSNGTRSMFGAGIYFAEHSSKSNQYVFGYMGGNGCQRHGDVNCFICNRKMLYCRVTLGSMYSLTSSSKLTNPPPGHHSVEGKPSWGGLRYPEYVIYRGDQAYPEYLVTYRIQLKPQL